MSALIPAVSIEALLAARDAAVAAFDGARRQLQDAQVGLSPFGVTLPSAKIEFPCGDGAPLESDEYADAIRWEIERKIWARLFELTQIDTIMDHKSRQALFERLHGRNSRSAARAPDEMPSLTRENIEATFAQIHSKQAEFFDNSIEAVYRALSWEHRTNEPSRIGETLIINGAFYNWGRKNQSDQGVRLDRHESLHDLERVLCLLNFQPPPTHEAGLRAMGYVPWGAWTDVPSTLGPDKPALMRVKVHRKGTTHVRITHQKHVDEMNWRMAQRFPGAIPPPQEAAAKAQSEQAQAPRTTALAKTDKQARQAFYTPPEVADELVARALRALDLRYGCEHGRFLEPSAGEGAIVRALFRARCERVTAIESDPHGIDMLVRLAERVNKGQEEPRLHVLGPDDFFAHEISAAYIGVVMNPPFANAQEVEHVLRAWAFVKPGGVLVSVMSKAVTFRTTGRYGVFAAFLERHGAQVTPLPSGSFVESGTNVETVMVLIKKAK